MIIEHKFELIYENAIENKIIFENKFSSPSECEILLKDFKKVLEDFFISLGENEAWIKTIYIIKVNPMDKIYDNMLPKFTHYNPVFLPRVLVKNNEIEKYIEFLGEYFKVYINRANEISIIEVSSSLGGN